MGVLLAGRLLFAAALVADGYELRRPAEPASLGGVAWVSNDTYLAVTDWSHALWEMKLPLDPTSGKPLSCELRRLCVLEKREDVEDVALDPLAPTSVWVADEYKTLLCRHDIATGKELERLAMPGALAKTRTDMGLESVAISRDGRELWTTSEEAVEADGPISSGSRGTDVRLTRFRREAKGGWTPAGQWIYRTDPIAGLSWKGKSNVDSARSGVSGLCVLDDGTLLVLEREFSVVFLPRFRCRVYEADLSGATDVSAMPSVRDAEVKRAGKRLLDETCGFSMYEGICQGQSLADGSRTVVLVSDGDDLPLETVRVLRLEPVPGVTAAKGAVLQR